MTLHLHHRAPLSSAPPSTSRWEKLFEKNNMQKRVVDGDVVDADSLKTKQYEVRRFWIEHPCAVTST